MKHYLNVLGSQHFYLIASIIVVDCSGSFVEIGIHGSKYIKKKKTKNNCKSRDTR